MDDIIWLKELSKRDVKEAGLKAAYLGELFNAGFSIPNGFVISTNCMKEFLLSNNLNDKIVSLIKKSDDLNETSREIHQLILNDNISNGLQSEILEAYETLNVNSELREAKLDVLNLIKSGRGNAIVSVRGSANIQNLSFAGQQNTFLNVAGSKKLIETIKKCWASLYTPRALSYFRTNNLNNVFSGVIIQKMIDFQKSGVIFTVNPITNNRNEMIIESGIGLGQSIVDGSVKPHIYVIDKNTLEVKNKIINRQKTKVIRDVNNNETVKKKIFDDEHKETLTNYEIGELVKLAIEAENHYGTPLNLEFGLEKKPYLLQARDITTLNKEIKVPDLIGEVILNGQSVSSGFAIGKASVVRNSSSSFEKGDILVSEFLDVNLLPLIRKAKGVVVNEGGSLSNLGIVCREWEIPVVVSDNATSELRNGLIVSIDGYNGKVFKGEAKVKVEIVDI